MMDGSIIFFNRCFDKKRLRNFILWFFSKYGEKETINLLESLKRIGFQYATKAGISIGLDDLKIPYIKSECINSTEQKINRAEIDYQRGNITEIERQQQFVYQWNLVSERLKRYVIQFFQATDVFNPIYMMAFSGARGNISQIRQLIGMRGLMADPQGQILEFPIRSNFKEGLTLTEYLISCYGARKGVVDTALRTATSGYLTRRLVDVTQQVIIGGQNCNTNRGIPFRDLSDGSKVLLSLKNRIIGRVLLNDIFFIDPLTKRRDKVGFKNQEISIIQAKKISRLNHQVLLRSPLTCRSSNSICQLCYGWNLSYNAVVSIGEAVGVIAAQSIGEPGTQLTMRTFHTGGVFTGSAIDQIYAPFAGEVNYISNFKGVLIRTLNGHIGFLTKNEGTLQVKTKTRYLKKRRWSDSDYTRDLDHLFISCQLKVNSVKLDNVRFLLRKISTIEKNLKTIGSKSNPSLIFNIPIHSILFVRNLDPISEMGLLAELFSVSTSDNRSQEIEQEIFTPTAGQIFFEDLSLIEKTKRDGSIRKIAYGSGSIWVVSATDWLFMVHPQIFPVHGDFISKNSAVQKLKIVIEKSYYLDRSFLEKIGNFRNIQKKLPLKKGAHRLNKITLNRNIYSNNIQKIYYQYFCYFVFVKPTRKILRGHLSLQTNNLSTRYKFIKNRKYKFNLNILLLGLNFGFNQSKPKSRIRRQKYRPSFLVYSGYNLENHENSRRFSSLLKLNYPLKSKLKNPISSRNFSEFKGRDMVYESYQYWFEIYRKSDSNNLYLMDWIFYYIKLPTSFDYISSRPGNSLSFLYGNFLKKRRIKKQRKRKEITQIQLSKISKSFFTKLIWNFFSLNFNSIQNLRFLGQCSWTSTTQTNLFLVNRQSLINSQISMFWYLPKSAILQNCTLSPSVRPTRETLIYIHNLNSEVLYSIKSITKPILMNPNFLIGVKKRIFYLHYYIIQNFLLSFYYKNFLRLKNDNYFFKSFKQKIERVGFQTRFKISILPNFIKIKSNHNKIPNNIKELFFRGDLHLYLQKDKLLVPKSIIRQNFLSWPCTYRGCFYSDFSGYLLNFGINIKNDIFFDRQRILFDIIYTGVSDRDKFSSYFTYKRFHKAKIRFSSHRLISKSLILFQKREYYTDLKTYYSKKLNNYYKDQGYLNSLIFNTQRDLTVNFKKSSVNTTKSLSVLHFEYNSIKGGFFQAAFLQIIKSKIEFLFNSDYRFSLTAYNPLRKGFEERFKLEDSIKLGTRLYPYLLDGSLASRSLELNSLRDIEVQSILTKQNECNSRTKLFYKRFKSPLVLDYFSLESFSLLLDGEVIYANSQKQKKERGFIILTRPNLVSFSLPKQKSFFKSPILMLGNFLRQGTRFEKQKVVSKSGQVISIDRKKFTIRRAQPFLITTKSIVNVYQDEIISKGSKLFSFLSLQVKTGDIIQGIPKIEELFEARLTRDGIPIMKNLHRQIEQLFQTYNAKFPNIIATQKCFEEVQYLIIEEIQKVYCSQGIFIADKHLEIVVRQMTSKVQIIRGGNTGFLAGELAEFNWIRMIEQFFGSDEISYAPIILGITRSCLETDSFISAASFQETTRVLTKAAIQNKIDFVRGLKQNVILGNLVPAGTGFFSPLYFKYSNFD